MNCSECERLFDAYLDGQLAGSLRLEFDAHRLRCRRCQQTLAMLETIGNVIASDPQVPEMSVTFTDRVMRQIQPPRRVYRPSLRVAV
ncbi:MAG: anti-sigma factor family protein, partial [Planctomycetota bacterium]